MNENLASIFGLAGNLEVAIKDFVSDYGGVTVPKDNIWVNVVPSLTGNHVSVKWDAHENEREGRTNAWVSNVSRDIAPVIGAVLKEHRAPAGTQVCVDAQPLLPKTERTGFYEI